MKFLTFPPLEKIPDIVAGITCRVPGIRVDLPREEALLALQGAHRSALSEAGAGTMVVATAEQVHGNHVSWADSGTSFPVSATDGLLTATPGICLGIYVADCAAVYLADRQARAIALVHSGKKGTDLGIAPRAVEALCQATKIHPSDLVAQVSPCIRPPHYESDFAATIRTQLRESGVVEVHDCGICTATNPDDWYSYRLEKGFTGRMLAFLAIQAQAGEGDRA